MDKATASKIVKAMATVRDLGEKGSETERASIAETLRRMADKLDAPKAKAVQTAPAKTVPVTAAQVEEAARAVIRAGGGFGSNKAFIAEVYAALSALSGLTLDAFKVQLYRMQRAGSVNLSRADLVEAMDPEMVRRSHMSDGISDWNFVTVG